MGFAVGSRELIDGLERVKNSFNSYPIDRLASAGAIAALQDREYFERTRQAVIKTRQDMARGSARWDSTCCLRRRTSSSPATGHDAAALAAALRERGIIVRHFRQPRIEQFLRITVGTDEQTGLLLAALADILNAR